MNLNDNQIAKIDPLLEEVLTQARGNEEIRAIMTLGSENQIKRDSWKVQLEPKQFSSYEAYRQALIDRRKSQLANEVGDTIQAIENLSLKTLGGNLSRVVVVEGSADAIARSLELPGVNHVSLDQLIALPKIAPDEAVQHLANLYINILDRSLEERTKKLISQASQQYIINYYKHHNKLQILGMQKPVDLDSIYTAVQCLPPSDIWGFESIEALQELYIHAGRRFPPRETDKQDGIAVANQQQYLMVLGVPGAGKSTFLRKIGLEALKGNQSEFQQKCIPVFIQLKQFTDCEINIEETIREEFRLCQLPFAEEFTIKALQKGKLLILLDGLDEVPTHKIERLEALKAEVPDDKQPRKVRLKFVERLQQTWLNAFNLSPEMVNLSKEEAIALENYLYANLLIIQCKQAAVQVSSKTWEAIEARMLLVPGD